ncbi:MAG: (2Fe-2S)-binding protein [SAR324 cluster bacterium]|nr:(2Fe-2S)-binding protein [SAR324 cluster bacterium]
MKSSVKLTVNGLEQEHQAEPRTSLLTFLREQCGLTGSKRGCEEGECGGCSVLLNGELVTSCLIFALEAQGAQLVTVEGLGTPHHLSPLQEAFATDGASQCGFCIPGMLLAATNLLERNPDPNEQDIRKAISGNLCRCTGYDLIVAAIGKAAELKKGARG